MIDGFSIYVHEGNWSAVSFVKRLWLWRRSRDVFVRGALCKTSCRSHISFMDILVEFTKVVVETPVFVVDRVLTTESVYFMDTELFRPSICL